MQEQDIVEVIENRYQIYVEKIEKNEESTDGNVYIIQDRNKRYVLKLYKTTEHAEAMVMIYQLLQYNKINAPLIIKSIYNNNYEEYKDFYFVLYSFVEGKKLKEIQMNKDVIKQVAQYLKKLHNIDINNKIKVTTISSDEKDKTVLLHFDITKNNIFISNDKIFFIDFDDAKYGPAVYDVAIAVTNLFISRAKGIDIEGINLFLKEYYQNNFDSKKEIIKNAAITWLTETINNPNMTTSIKVGLENKLNYVSRLWSE